MKWSAPIIAGIVLVALLAIYPPTVYSQVVTPPPLTPPPQPVPEGNIFTVAGLVGSGLYILWLRRKEG
jgi:hypothetical protein